MLHNIKVSRRLVAFALLAMLIGQAGQPVAAQPGSRLFPETGKTVRQPFLAYWQQHGGLAQQGYPISDEFNEVNAADGRSYRTQYFERARFEYHPEQRDLAVQVLLGLLGREALAASDPAGDYNNAAVQSVPGVGRRSFAETGKTVTGLFLAYWQQHGGLAQQGFPITEAFLQTNATDGKPYITQYFERARFEYHPEQRDPQAQVLLGLVGRELYAQKTGPTRLLKLVTARIDVPANSYRHIRANCPTDNDILVGGGWLADPALKLRLSTHDSDAWKVGADNDTASEHPLTAYAVCLTSPLQTTVVQTQATDQLIPNRVIDVVAACTSGVLTGGGFASVGSSLLRTVMPGTTGRNWQVTAVGQGNDRPNLDSFAVCLTDGPINAPTPVSRATQVAAGTEVSVTADCPANALASGGGFAAEEGSYHILASRPLPGGRGWQATLKNDGSQPLTLTAYAMCATIRLRT